MIPRCVQLLRRLAAGQRHEQLLHEVRLVAPLLRKQLKLDLLQEPHQPLLYVRRQSVAVEAPGPSQRPRHAPESPCALSPASCTAAAAWPRPAPAARGHGRFEWWGEGCVGGMPPLGRGAILSQNGHG